MCVRVRVSLCRAEERIGLCGDCNFARREGMLCSTHDKQTQAQIYISERGVILYDDRDIKSL